MLTVEQKEQRKLGLGATDCAAVMGLSPYRTPYELWMIKTGRMEEETILDENRLRLRHAHEQTIANEYEVQRSVKLRRANITRVHKRLPFMLCNLDRVVEGKRKIVECKTSTAWLRQNWGETGTDEAPIQYILQVQHQLACTEYEDADLAALIDIDDYRIYPMPRNEKVIEKIEGACEYFWEHHVVKDIPPAPTTRGDLKLMYPLNNGKLIEAPTDVLSYIDEVYRIKSDVKALDKEQEKIEKEIIQFIADNDGINEGDKLIVTFKADKNGKRSLRIKERA